MSSVIKIGIIGDYDGRPSHVATEASIMHTSSKLGINSEIIWLPTAELEQVLEDKLHDFDGFWCAPGSPYQSMWGAIYAIGYARVHNVPFLGTCGGFQHAALELAKNVLQAPELESKEFDPYSPNLFLTALSCSLTAQNRHLWIDRDSIIYKIYQREETDEKYNCSFGLNKEFEERLKQNGVCMAGFDDAGEARILALEEKRFYIATLFQPQLSSTPDNPHPLILSFLAEANLYHKDKQCNSFQTSQSLE